MTSRDGFLSCFPGSHVFCAIDDSKKDHRLIHYHEGYDLSRDEIMDKLDELNSGTHGEFFCVNEISRRNDPQKHRTSKMLTRIRAVWADEDNVRDFPRDDFAIRPSVIVQSSQGKFHYYWLTTTDKIEEWGYVMNSIANTYETDGNAKDLVRVLRMPDFLHHKGEPFLTQYHVYSDTPYMWNDVVKAFPPNFDVKPRNVMEGRAATDRRMFTNYAEARDAIIQGVNFHGAIMWLLNHWVNSGTRDQNQLVDRITDLLRQSEVQDDRWEARISHEYLTNNARDAAKFVEDNPIHEIVELPIINEQNSSLQLSWPPGMMGEMCRQIHQMMHYPNREIAIAAGFGVCAGIVGRAYNILGDGLNLYVALTAPTSMGKSVVKRAINQAFNIVPTVASSYVGSSHFTGAKGLWGEFENGLCKVCVMEEAGIFGMTRSGDQSSLDAVLLDVFVESGFGRVVHGIRYSKAEDSLGTLNSPALTIVEISTPHVYREMLAERKFQETGRLGRTWSLNVDADKPDRNKNVRLDYDGPVRARIEELIFGTKDFQVDTQKQPTEFGSGALDVDGIGRHWTQLFNRHRKTDELKAGMAGRNAQKIAKLAACISVFDAHSKISDPAAKWANEAIEVEYTLINRFVGGIADDMGQIFKEITGPAIVSCLNYSNKSPKMNPPDVLKGKNIFTASNLNQLLRRHSKINGLNDKGGRSSNPKAGIEKQLMYMLRSGLIEDVQQPELRAIGAVRTKYAFRITNLFKDFMEADESE